MLLISKDPIGYGSTRPSLGLIASCGLEAPDDNPEAFYDDLLAGGDHLNSPKVAQAMADEARMSPAIAEGLALLFRPRCIPTHSISMSAHDPSLSINSPACS